MPDFQQFAERCKAQSAEFKSGDDAPFIFDANEYARLFDQAERHARLLQQIWEWAEKSDSDAPWGYDGDYYTATRQLKAQVRSLLVGEQEGQ